MPESTLKVIKRCAEWQLREDIKKIPKGTRGIYSLVNYKGKNKYDVVYVGMAGGRGGIKERLGSHARSSRKNKLWTHFSIYEVWDNIRQDEVEELEGLFRHIYRKDTQANSLNRQKWYWKLGKIRVQELEKWKNN